MAFLFRTLLFSLYIPFVINDLLKYSLSILIINIFLNTLVILGVVLFFEALRIGNASLVGTIAAAFSAVTVILSIIFLNEEVNFNQIIAIIVLFVGLVMTTLDFKSVSQKHLIKDKGIFLAFLVMILWGIYFTFIKIPVRQVGWFWPNYLLFINLPLLLLLMKKYKIKLIMPNFKGSFAPLIFALTFTAIADFSYNFAISRSLTAIVAPIAGSYPTIFVLLAFLIFKDPITRQQILGIIITLIGIVLLSIFST